MKTLLRATCLCLGFAGMAHAESDALIVDTSEGSMFGRLTGSGDLSAATADLRRQNVDVVSLVDARASDLSDGLRQFLDGLDAETERAVVVLSGRFAHSATDTYFLSADAAEETDLGSVLDTAIPLSQVLAVLSAYPGQALLVLGEGETQLSDARFLRPGAADDLDLPQGVSLLRGLPEDVARLVRRDLAVPERTLLAAARSRGLSVDGYAPEDWVFLPAPPAEGDIVAAPDPVPQPDLADQQLWDEVTARDELEGYRNYLSAFPEGQHANAARQRIRAIQDDPLRDARRAEERLELSRDARREIQRDLSLLDYNTRGIDGIFGPGTRGAVKAWQDENDFAATGFLDTEMIARLDGQAERRAAEIEEEAQRRQAETERLDRAYWEETGAQGDLPGLRAYLERYPDGVFAELAQSRVDAIESERRDAAAARDRQAWNAAREVGSVQAYRSYLADFPDGAFAGEAQERIAEQQQGVEQREATAQAAAQEAALGLNAISRRLAENRLEALGLKPGAVDGQFDDRTRRAIRRYQDARQLQVTGYLDQATVVRLLADSLLR